MKRKLFDRSSEKHATETDGQLTLFDEPEEEKPAILPAAEISAFLQCRVSNTATSCLRMSGTLRKKATRTGR